MLKHDGSIIKFIILFKQHNIEGKSKSFYFLFCLSQREELSQTDVLLSFERQSCQMGLYTVHTKREKIHLIAFLFMKTVQIIIKKIKHETISLI